MSKNEEAYPGWSLELKRKEQVARDTFAFYFTRPKDSSTVGASPKNSSAVGAGPEGFAFTAGQNIRLFFDDFPEGERRRTFTIASAPHERDIVIVMRMRGSAWKNKIGSLSPGDHVRAEGPTGEHFVLHEDTNIPAVFIAGGVGIAPFVSILSDITHRKLGYTITLFYSNKTKEDAPFLETLKEYVGENKNVQIVFTVTGKENDISWGGETGRIDATMIRKYVLDTNAPLYYVVGTPAMVADMRGVLLGMGVPDKRIVTKEFKGY